VYKPLSLLPSAAVAPSLVANAIIVPLTGGIEDKPALPPLSHALYCLYISFFKAHSNSNLHCFQI